MTSTQLPVPLSQIEPGFPADFVTIHLTDFDSSQSRIGLIHSTLRPVDNFITSEMELDDYFILSMGTGGGFEWKNEHTTGKSRTLPGLFSTQLTHTPSSWRWHGVQTNLMLCIPMNIRLRMIAEMFSGDPLHVQLRNHYAFYDPLLYSLALGLFSATRQKELSTPLYQEYLSLAFTSHVYRYYSDHTSLNIQYPTHSGLTTREIALVRDYLNVHYYEDLHLDGIANVLGYSPYYFSRQYKRTTGHSIHHALTQVRIEHAKTLLVQTELSVSEIAEKVGFRHYETMLRQFNHAVGMSPREFAKMNKKRHL